MKLSIITINLNNKPGLEKTIQSVISQSCKHFEYIVIDGDSNDGSKEIVEKNKNFISKSVSEKDNGIYNAMNKGIKIATGEYLLFLNSGDILSGNDIIGNILPELHTNGIVYGDMIIETKGNRKKAESDNPLMFEEMIRGTLWHPVSFIKKELFEKFGLYNESYKIISDYEFFLRVIFVERIPVRHIPHYISIFNTDGIGSSEKHALLHAAEKKEVQLKYFHPEVIESAMRFSEMKRSKAQIIDSFIRSKPLLLSTARFIYKIGRKIV